MEGSVNGIDTGYLTGDLNITANTWGQSYNSGEYGITGSVLSNQPTMPVESECPTTMELGELGRGVAARDSASGLGWIMWSNQSVHSRFIPNPNSSNTEHLIAVKLVDEQWHYDNNQTLTPFTPDTDDCLVAELNFDTDSVSLLQNVEGSVNGIDTGYLTGDLNITANTWGQSYNSGEYGITGSVLSNQPTMPVESECPTTMELGELGRGVAARDSASGLGWIMWSNQSVHSRFIPNPNSSNTEHLIAVKLVDEQWHYDNNQTLTPFTPDTDDCLVAELNFDTDSVSLLQNVEGSVNGIDTGYLTGDLNITANTWGQSYNSGEYGITGSVLSNQPLASAPMTPAITLPVENSDFELGESIVLQWQADPLANTYDYGLFNPNDDTTTYDPAIDSSDFCTSTTCSINVVSDLPIGQGYQVRIRASNSFGNSDWSERNFNIVQVPIDTTIPPSTPDGLAGDITGSGASQTVSITWNASTDDQSVAGYNRL